MNKSRARSNGETDKKKKKNDLPQDGLYGAFHGRVLHSVRVEVRRASVARASPEPNLESHPERAAAAAAARGAEAGARLRKIELKPIKHGI